MYPMSCIVFSTRDCVFSTMDYVFSTMMGNEVNLFPQRI